MFDLIIGIETKQRLCIVLDFKTKMKNVDEITLPMRKLKNLQSRNALTSIFGHTEPIATLHETKQMVKILNAQYKKADLPKEVSNSCTHLNRNQAISVLAGTLTLNIECATKTLALESHQCSFIYPKDK